MISARTALLALFAAALSLVGARAAECAADGTVRSEDAFIRTDGDRWTLGTALVEKELAFEDGRLFVARFTHKAAARELLPPGGPVDEVSAGVAGVEGDGPWTLRGAQARVLAQGEVSLTVTLRRGGLEVAKTYVAYPGTGLIREWLVLTNVGDAPLVVAEPRFLNLAARPAADPAALDFHWMVGAENYPGCWTLRTEALEAGRARVFDSYDAFPCPAPGSRAGGAHRMASSSYAPWYALADRRGGGGVVIGWDTFARWASEFRTDGDGTVRAALKVAGHRRTLAPGEAVTTPAAFVCCYAGDLDDAGNALLDWQYRYLWDYTREPWFPAVPMLHCWAKGTGWGKPGVDWWGGEADIPSQFRKIFRAADLMRSVGGDVYHRDWGWWDHAGDWNGPDFRASGAYLAKYGMGQLIYAFLYTIDPRSKLAAAHPQWIIDGTLDMSQPAVVAHLKRQLDGFVDRWGDFEWRNDSTPTAPRGKDDTVLLAQDQGFREVIRAFLDAHPRCGFQSVNGGGNEAGYDYVRYSNAFQFSDGAVGPLRNYWASLLFPPDKLIDNGDSWEPDKYDKAAWRGLLCFAIATTGDTQDPARLEGLRELFDLYHYLASQGVVGRWVRVYRPHVEGEDPTMVFQRLSRDGLRGVIIPKRPAPGPVTIRPKGLLPQAQYRVTLHESPYDATRTGADLMARGIVIQKMAPGELIYLNLPLHPGSGRDKTPPSPPGKVECRWGENMGFPGVEVSWQPASDDHWVSYYEVLRDGQVLEKAAKGTFHFDHSAGADAAARYEVRTVDGSGNRSACVVAEGGGGARSRVIDDADSALRRSGAWEDVRSEPAAHAGTLARSNEAGAACEAAVEGGRVLWFSRMGPHCGKALISVNGGPAEEVDTYSADDIWGVCLWSKDLPDGGPHTVRVTVSGERNAWSCGTYIYVDGVRVAPRGQ